ncbi:hypothetical protein LTR53_007876, partial [Teratosphaeriaceae sp. CCFEE 6253]
FTFNIILDMAIISKYYAMHRLAVNLAVRKFSRGAAEERLTKYTSTTFAIRFIAIVGFLALCTSATVWQSL